MHDAYRPTELDREALAWLDRVAVTAPMDERLTSVADATVMQKAIRRTLALLSGLDISQLLKRQGLIARLTGADLEARLRLDLAAQQVTQCFADLALAARRTRQLVDVIVLERQRMISELAQLTAAIESAERLLENGKGADADLLTRFDRRLSNLTALHVANRMAVQQFAMVENGLSAMLDRYTDIVTVVIPLWQQHLVALLHSNTRLRRDDAAVSGFLVCQSALEEYFSGEAKLCTQSQ